MASLNDYLAFIRPHVAPELISDQGWAGITPVAERLPGALAFSVFGFERPLDTDDGWADFLCSLDKANSGPDILAGYLPDHDIAALCFREDAWRRIRNFGRAWSEPTSPLHALADDVWLEFDVRRGPAGPSLFLAPRPTGQPARTGERVFDPAFDPAGLPVLLDAAHGALFGRPPDQALAARWQSLIERLPRPTALFQVGFMLARPEPDGLRVCVSLRAGELKPFLAGLWPGDLAEVTTLAKALSPWFGSFAVHLNIGAAVGAEIGLECRFNHRRGPEREPGWPGFLDFLVEQGLCRPSLARALPVYGGYAPTDRDRCPAELGRMIDRQALAFRSFFVRKIFHVKLSLEPGQDWRAKAYLGVGHIWKGLGGESQLGRGSWGPIG